MTTKNRVVAIVVPDEIWERVEVLRDRGQSIKESNSSLYLRVVKAGLEQFEKK